MRDCCCTGGSRVNRTVALAREQGVSPSSSHIGDSQISVIPADEMSSLNAAGIKYAHGAHTDMQTQHSHIK